MKLEIELHELSEVELEILQLVTRGQMGASQMYEWIYSDDSELRGKRLAYLNKLECAGMVNCIIRVNERLLDVDMTEIGRQIYQQIGV